MRTRTGKTLTILFMLAAVSNFYPLGASAQNPIVSESLTLTVYLDGFILVTHELEVNQTYPAVNITLMGQDCIDLLFLDEQNLPLNYQTTLGKATVHTLGAGKIKATYLTQELTAKTSRYWTLTANVPTNTTVMLPENVTIISLNNIPEQIETSEARILLVMPPGTIEITYLADRSFIEQTTEQETPWPLIISLSLVPFLSILLAFWIRKRKMGTKAKAEETEVLPTVDLDKLLEREKDLRPEELQVIQFLSEKNGKALEAEIYEKLELPRTTTWRLLKRLEKMEILDIRKARRQNTVSIRKKYMKTSKKP